MKIIKKINNNVALAQDARGNDLVVFGKGVGFPPMPCELKDLSNVQRTFTMSASGTSTCCRICPKGCCTACASDGFLMPEGACPLPAFFFF